MMSIWPALVVAGVSFALPQYLVSNFHGPWLVDVVAAIVSMAALALFLRGWKPRELWLSTTRDNSIAGAKAVGAQVVHDSEYERRASQYTRGQVIKAWVPGSS